MGHRRVHRAELPAPADAGQTDGWRSDSRQARSQRTALAAFDAFRQRHYQPYLEYAALRLERRDAAETVVAAAFTELAIAWHLVLGSCEPAAIAWRILHDHVDRALGRPARGALPDAAIRALEEDAQLLHDHMQLSSERTAEVMGIPPAALVGLLPPTTSSTPPKE